METETQTTEEPDPPEQNPSDAELEVEGPNESAPGHEPSDDDSSGESS